MEEKQLAIALKVRLTLTYLQKKETLSNTSLQNGNDSKGYQLTIQVFKSGQVELSSLALLKLP